MQLFYLLLLAGTLVTHAISFPGGRHDRPSQVLYFLENDPSGAKLAAVEIMRNGSLGHITETSTAGKGLQVLNTATESPLGPDSLASQGAVAIQDDLIFSVNPGSNTVVMLKIDPADPLHPTIVGEPVDSLGDFPISVTYSHKLKTACVVNSGARNGVGCFSVSSSGLKPLDTTARSVSPALQQTTPPKGPEQTASQISFSPESDYVIATIKGIQPAHLATIFVWKVENGIVARSSVPTQIPGLYDAFGFSFVGSNDRLFVTSDYYGGSFLALDPELLTLKLTSNVTLPGQQAPCWSAYCKELNTVYAVEGGGPAIGVADVSTEKLTGVIKYDENLLGGFDNVVVGTTMFFLAKTAEIAVLDLKGKELITSLDLSGRVGDRKFWQGLGLWSLTWEEMSLK